MNFISPQVAGEVRAEMARQRITVERLATATKIPPSRLHRRFSGRVAFDTDELAAIAAYLGVQASELVARAERVA